MSKTVYTIYNRIADALNIASGDHAQEAERYTRELRYSSLGRQIRREMTEAQVRNTLYTTLR